MTTRNVRTLIRRVRKEAQLKSGNYEEGVGVKDLEIVDLLNDAIDHFVEQVVISNPTIFHKTVEFSLAGNSEITIRGELMHQSQVVDLKYKSDTYTSGWIDVKQKPVHEMYSTAETIFVPLGYSISDGQLLLEGATADGTFRLVYEQKPRKLGFYLGQVTSVSTTNNQISGINLALPTDLTQSYLDANFFDHELCFTDGEGAYKAQNVPYTLITDPGQVVMDAYSLQEGEAIAVNDHVTQGTNTSITSDLPIESERFLVYYAVEAIAGNKGASFERQTFLRRRKEEALASLLSVFEEPSQDDWDITVADECIMMGLE